MLVLIGISYGRQWLTVEAMAELRKADTVIAYHEYVDSVRDLLPQDAESFDAMDDVRADENFLMARVRHAIKAIDNGKRVVILSNGDVNIYGMSGAVIRELDRLGRPDIASQTVVCPGISAFQIAASRLGGPLSNGFATFGLCIADVPAEVVHQRIQASAQGDFVTVVYMLRHNAEMLPELYPQVENPRQISHTRLNRVVDSFLACRAEGTPCVISTNLGRHDEVLHHVTLAKLKHKFELIEANSILLISGSDTLVFGEKLVSPLW